MCTLTLVSWMGNLRGSSSLLSSPSISFTFFAISYSSTCKSGWWYDSYCTMWSNGRGWVGVGYFFFLFIWLNENTMEEKNAYFNASLATTPEIDEAWYCNKNVSTPKATDFNYQPRVRTKLRGLDTICEKYNVSFLCYHYVMECMHWN